MDINSGASVARSKSIELASGDYIAFLDSDDIWKSDKLEKQIEFMNKNDINFSCTSYEKVDESELMLPSVVKSLPKVNYKRILKDCPVGNSTVIYNVSKLGKFQVPDIRKRNDLALWLKILKKEEYIYGMPNVLTTYRVRASSLSRNKIGLIKYHWVLYRNVEQLSLLTSIYNIGYLCVVKFFHIIKRRINRLKKY